MPPTTITGNASGEVAGSSLLGALVYGDAWWVTPFIASIAAVVVAGGVLGYVRGGVSERVRREVLENVLILFWTVITTGTTVYIFDLGSVVGALVGIVAGYGLAQYWFRLLWAETFSSPG